ncbi:MAG: TRAP transporter large permease subunit [Ectothiorhodospiraceae bacterium]|nr:TRAP transporter large permease subunit [Chromatiales bacterium]MCP5155523.1 TRAP transporter large permease subunit [Ectothiorhodospiraceae bacterium]
MFPALFVMVFLGIPIAFSLLACAFLFGLPLYGMKIGLQMYAGITQTASQFLLSAVPPFVFMGFMLERSGIAERLFQAMQLWLGRLPGGLALATLAMAAVIAAATGIVGAVEVVIGVMAIPAMLQLRYSRVLISGTICAGGSLGTMIPPSLVVVIYASVANQSVGQLFAGVLAPAVVMVSLFFGYILSVCLIKPHLGPPAPEIAAVPLGRKLWITLTALIPAVVLILAVLGAIIAGIATPTEAASVGALGALILTIVYRRFRWSVLSDTLRETLLVNCMILLIVVGGSMFAGVFRIHGGNQLVAGLVEGLGLGETGLVLVLLAVVFVAGFILDWVSVVLLCLPIYLPLLEAVGVDMVWFAVLMVIVIQTSYLTPPMAPSIFYLRSIAPPEITFGDMYRGVTPFIICQVITLLVVFFWPPFATWLPSVLVTGF